MTDTSWNTYPTETRISDELEMELTTTAPMPRRIAATSINNSQQPARIQSTFKPIGQCEKPRPRTPMQFDTYEIRECPACKQNVPYRLAHSAFIKGEPARFCQSCGVEFD